MISMLGDAEGNGPGGFLLLDEDFDVAGHVGKYGTMECLSTMISGISLATMLWSAASLARPIRTCRALASTMSGRDCTGSRFTSGIGRQRRIVQSVDLGEEGLIPLEVRFHHNPDSLHGFVGAALSSTLWHWNKPNGHWTVEKALGIPPVEVEGWPFPVPSLITDLLISLDDRYLYLSNWLHGDIRQYDISDPAQPKLTGQVWCGGVLGKGGTVKGNQFQGGSADAAAQPGRKAALCHKFAAEQLG